METVATLPPPPTVGQNLLKGEVSISHVTSSILDVILAICMARNVCLKSINISNQFCKFCKFIVLNTYLYIRQECHDYLKDFIWQHQKDVLIQFIDFCAIYWRCTKTEDPTPCHMQIIDKHYKNSFLLRGNCNCNCRFLLLCFSF